MKRIYLLLILLFTFSIIACSSTKKATTASNQTKDSIKSDTYRVIVSFISTGQGIDRVAKEKFIAYSDTISAIIQKKIKTEEIHWGREGEVDYCFKLTELDSLQQNHFVNDLIDLFKHNKLVFIKENSPCINKR